MTGHGALTPARDRVGGGSGPDERQRARRFGARVFLAIVLLSAGGAFVGLDTSSLWNDELYSAYFSDPGQASLGAMLLRAAEDVHPPLYYALVYLAAQLGGDFTVVARGLSAVIAILTLAVVYRAFPRGVGRFPRLFACAFAATSEVWFLKSQEIRSYGLALLFSAVFLHLGIRLQGALGSGRAPRGALAAFVLAGMLAGLTHFYLLLLAAGMIATLLLFSVNWRQRAVLCGAGLLIPIPALAFIAWQGRQGFEAAGWLSADGGFLFYHTATGLMQLLGSAVGTVSVLALLSAYGLLRWSGRLRQGDAEAAGRLHVFIVLPCVLTVALSLLITFAYVPNYQSKLYFVLAPFLWVFLGLIAEALTRDHRLAWPVVGLLVALICVSGTRVLWRAVPMKEEWRASAEAVDALAACKGARIPVALPAGDKIRGDMGRRFYGYYLESSRSVDFLKVPQDRVPETFAQEPLKSLVGARLDGEDPCPILLWSSHHLHRDEIDSLARAVEAGHGGRGAARVRVREFSVPEKYDFLFSFFFTVKPPSSFLVLANAGEPARRE